MQARDLDMDYMKFMHVQIYMKVGSKGLIPV
jgi:hypothetical protein